MCGRKSKPDFRTERDVVNCYIFQSMQVYFNLEMFKFASYRSCVVQKFVLYSQLQIHKFACIVPPSETSQSKHLMPGGDSSWLVPFPGIL